VNIDDLATRTELSPRQLRYVIEYRILPSVNMLDDLRPGKGRGREFSDFTGFCISLAARMRDMGLNRKLVKQVMETVLEYRRSGLDPGMVMFPVLQHVFSFARHSVLEIGDGCNLRIVSTPAQITTPSNSVQRLSMHWTQMSTQAELGDRYEPSTTMSIRLDRLAKQVRSGG